jgi:hypothetical protein
MAGCVHVAMHMCVDSKICAGRGGARRLTGCCHSSLRPIPTAHYCLVTNPVMADKKAMESAIVLAANSTVCTCTIQD